MLPHLFPVHQCLSLLAFTLEGNQQTRGHCTEYLEAPVLPDQGRLLPSHGAASCEHGSQCDVNRAPC